VIRFVDVHKSYRVDGKDIPALQPFDLDIADGEVFGIIGLSGAGKSTLIRLINLLERPSGGRIFVGDTEMTALAEPTLRAQRRRIGMIFQHFNLLASQTVADNVAFPLRLAGERDAGVLRARVDELLAHGVQRSQIVLDPGIGFAKNAKQSWAVLGHLREFETLGYPVLVGASRKSFLGALLPKGTPASERDRPTAVISALAAEAGAWGVRVHDVAGTKAALDVWKAWSADAATEAGR
jgi:ABC-type sugar transport system ATPase subunit